MTLVRAQLGDRLCRQLARVPAMAAPLSSGRRAGDQFL
jgi:hypothetical protein